MATTYDDFDFTPTEALILEVLAARYRLGNKTWTFESRSNASLKKLADKGLLNFNSASTEGASLVWLTDLGVAILFPNKYSSPVKFSELKKIQKELRKKAKGKE